MTLSIGRGSAAPGRGRTFGVGAAAPAAGTRAGCDARGRCRAPLHLFERAPTRPAVVLGCERRRTEQAHEFRLRRPAEDTVRRPGRARVGPFHRRANRILLAGSFHAFHGRGRASSQRAPAPWTGAGTPAAASAGPTSAANRVRTGSPAPASTPASTSGRSAPP